MALTRDEVIEIFRFINKEIVRFNSLQTDPRRELKTFEELNVNNVEAFVKQLNRLQLITHPDKGGTEKGGAMVNNAKDDFPQFFIDNPGLVLQNNLPENKSQAADKGTSSSFTPQPAAQPSRQGSSEKISTDECIRRIQSLTLETPGGNTAEQIQKLFRAIINEDEKEIAFKRLFQEASQNKDNFIINSIYRLVTQACVQQALLEKLNQGDWWNRVNVKLLTYIDASHTQNDMNNFIKQVSETGKNGLRKAINNILNRYDHPDNILIVLKVAIALHVHGHTPTITIIETTNRAQYHTIRQLICSPGQPGNVVEGHAVVSMLSPDTVVSLIHDFSVDPKHYSQGLTPLIQRVILDLKHGKTQESALVMVKSLCHGKEKHVDIKLLQNVLVSNDEKILLHAANELVKLQLENSAPEQVRELKFSFVSGNIERVFDALSIHKNPIMGLFRKSKAVERLDESVKREYDKQHKAKGPRH